MEPSRNFNLDTHYLYTCVCAECGRGEGGETEQKISVEAITNCLDRASVRTSVVLGPWYSVRVLIQYCVITFRATSMAHTDIDAINKNTYNFYLVIEVPDHVYVLVGKI